MSASFIHTHLHSEYSLIDSTIRIPALVDACVAAGMPAIALTDDSNMFALVKFYRACTAAGIKPLCGIDLWISAIDDTCPWRLTLLCQNHAGYLNMSQLISRAWRDGQHEGRARVDGKWLTPQSTSGLIALLGRESKVAKIALNQGIDAARRTLYRLSTLFPGRLYLELTRCDRDHEAQWNKLALILADALDLPVIASNDVRFLGQSDFDSHEARVCIHQGRVLDDPRRPRHYSAQQYLKSPAEMAELFADLPEALENTVELAKRCTLELDFGHYHLPDFPVPEGYDLNSYMRELAHDGLTRRLNQTHQTNQTANHRLEDYRARLNRELDVIINMGFSGYFLIVADFINWAKQRDIPVGPGRGSGAGSLVAWALQITDLDPLPLNLLFERFLNPERVSMPDFDIDFCMERRDEVIDYVTKKYGRDHVSQIITYGSMTARAVLRDSGRVLGMGYGQVDKLAKLIPNRPLDLTLADALGHSEKSRNEPDRVVKEFCETFAEDEDAHNLIELALTLENLTRNVSKHAGGVVISPRPLTEFTPLYCEPGGHSLVSQYDKDDVESVGLVKFDFLGLRTLTIIDWAVKTINARRARLGEDALNIAHIALDDAASYELLKKAQTIAVFQLESPGMQRMLKEARPDRFEDIVALVALYRPGPMELIPSFIARKHGKEKVSYPDPRIASVLEETYGIMVYQEQVMQMAQIVGGYTLGAADLLRRAMGKKKIEEMIRHRTHFREGAAQKGLSNTQADAIFDLMEKFAGYGFNKSHAAAYALVSYQTAWLKAHYPAEFMAAAISSDMDNTDKVVTFIDEARAIGIHVLPPDVNTSDYRFVSHEAIDTSTPAEPLIRYGLGAIKGVGKSVCEEIVRHRQHGPYRDLNDFCRRMNPGKLNRRALEALVLSGSLDALAPNRASAWEQLPAALKAAEQHARDQQSGQKDMFGGTTDNTEAIGKEEPPANSVDWPMGHKLKGERATLGLYLSGHPTDPWKAELAQCANSPLGEISKHYPTSRSSAAHNDDNYRFQRNPDTPWTVAGMVSVVRKRAEDAFVRIEDGSGSIEVSFFGELYQQSASLLVREEMLVIEGGLRPDELAGSGFQLRARRVTRFADACRDQAQLLCIRLNEIDLSFSQTLKQVLRDHQGGHTRIILVGYHNQHARANLELGEAWRIKANPDLLRVLRGLPEVQAAYLQLRSNAKPAAQ